MGGTRRKLRGKYNPVEKKRKYPNLQWTRLPAEASAKAGLTPGKRVKACTKCIKTQTKGK